MGKTQERSGKKAAPKASAKSTARGSKPMSRSGKGGNVYSRAKETEAWWSIDTSKEDDAGKKKIPQGGSAVVTKFMEAMGYDLDYAKVILEGYRQFLAVKKGQKDWEGKKLGPCAVIDAMWEVHSEMPDYESDINFLCGCFLPYISRDDESKGCHFFDESLVPATVDAIRKRFGKEKLNESVWNIIFICMHSASDSDIATYFANKKTPLSNMIEGWAEERKVGTSDYEFFFKRKRVNGSHTPIMLGMTSGDNLEVLPRQKLRLLVHDTSIIGRPRPRADGRSAIDAWGYNHKAEHTLSYLMNTHAKNVGVKKSRLVFTFMGKRIFGHEHPRDFKMISYDTIDVVSVDSYRCARCICCNPNSAFSSLC